MKEKKDLQRKGRIFIIKNGISVKEKPVKNKTKTKSKHKNKKMYGPGRK